MTEIKRHTRQYADQQRYIESLGVVDAQLQQLADKSPDEIRGFFYTESFAPVVSRLIRPIVRLGQRPTAFLDIKELKHPDGPEVLTASVHFKRLGEVKRTAFVLRASGSEPEDLGVMLALRSGNMLRKEGNSTVTLGEQKAPVVEDPVLALSAMSEFTHRLRSALGYEEMPDQAEAAA